jgi:DNA polymerase (family 10)
MKNRELASVFADIADLLAIKGESRYRIIAYERASEAILGLGQDVETIWKDGALQEIPSVGEAIAAKIDELLRTGRLEYYEKLTQKIPGTLVEVLRVSNVGPKKAALFYKELGVKTVDELERAAEEGRLADLPGMGEKSQQKILSGIESMRKQQTGRMLLGEAGPAAEELLMKLRQVEGVEQAEAAGSLRRMRETIGDVDLIVANKKPEAVMKAFVSQDSVDEVRGRGDTKSSVVLRNGLRVQVWIHPPERFGSALQYATGSKDHNVRLRELALKQGLSLSEHGFKREDESEILCATEAEVYETIGLPWIPPEMREGSGEVEAALEGNLPDLIQLDDIKGDLHTHSDWSDGKLPMETMVEAAVKAGYSYYAISDHSRSLGVAGGLSIEKLRRQRKEINELQKRLGDSLRLLQGAEVEILADGSLDYPDEVLAELDIVIASLHTSLRQERSVVTERLLGVIQNPHVDVIGHPSGRLLGRREAADLDMEQVFHAAAETGTALEINGNPERIDLNAPHVRRALKLGCLLMINTDAHHTSHLDFMRYGVGTARRGWAQAESVINTWDWKRIEGWLEAD